MLCIEQFTCAKDPSNPHTNEDHTVVMPGSVLAVMDGATDITGNCYDDLLGLGATGGRLASRAVMRALHEFAARPFDALPEPAQIVAVANASLRAVYDRLGISMADATSGHVRFRTTLAAAFFAGDDVRMVCIGDTALRINGGEVLRHDFPADKVFSAARSIAWGLLKARGADPDAMTDATRKLIVQGLSGDSLLPEPLTPQDGMTIADQVINDPRVIAAFGNDKDRIAEVLALGLMGVRRNPGVFSADVIDGYADASAAALCRDIPLAELDTLEIFSDGYPEIPDSPTLAAWEAALRHVDAVDPDRIGPYASTKGCAPGRFGDDRTILIARRTPPPIV